jgi:hypothetical protein
MELCRFSNFLTKTRYKDRYAYLDEVFFDRTEELKSMQKTLHEIIETNEDAKIKIKAIDQLQSMTSELSNYYGQLPQIANLGVDTFGTATTSIIENNESSNNPLLEY